MPKYLIQASYTAEGAKGLLKEGGSSRRKTVEAMLKKLDGKLESFYFAFGDYDVYTIVDLPDHQSATALALTINQSGAVRLSTTILLSPAEVDEAVKKSVVYRAPGQ